MSPVLRFWTKPHLSTLVARTRFCESADPESSMGPYFMVALTGRVTPASRATIRTDVVRLHHVTRPHRAMAPPFLHCGGPPLPRVPPPRDAHVILKSQASMQASCVCADAV